MNLSQMRGEIHEKSETFRYESPYICKKNY